VLTLNSKIDMKINIIKYILLGALSLPLVMSSCSEDRMDEINKNINDPVDVSAKFIITDIITRTAFNNVGGDINTYMSTYVEHEVGTHNQLWDAEHRVNQPHLSSTFNNSWVSIYNALRDAKIVVNKCSEGGSEEGNFTSLGIAQILAAYNLALLTDLYGDVPYSEALNPFENKTPKLDKQQDLYSEVLKYLDEAIVNLPKGDVSAVGGQDILYSGARDKWAKFAYGLKARYTMRLLKVASNANATLEDVIAFANQSFTTASDEAAFKIYNAQNLNPLFDFQWSRDGLAASKSLADKLIERNDPRLRRNFVNADWVQIDNLEPGSEAYDLLAVNGENEQIQYTYNTSTFVFSQTAPTLLLSYHEILFLKAEAMQRLNKPANEIEEILRAAVTAAIINSEKSVATAFTAPTLAPYGGLEETTDPIEETEIEDYLDNQVIPLFTANPLKEIAVQKYLAFFGASGESTEMYNDIRRWKALGGVNENLVLLKNTNRFPLRLPYGNTETTTNPNVQAAYGNGQYVYSENVWWAGGTR